MPQSGTGYVEIFEDFTGITEDTDLAIVDADGLRYNNILIVAQSGDVAMNANVTSPNGLATFSGAGGAADGIAILTAPFQPSTQGTISTEIRFRLSAVTAERFFFGFASTVDRDETVVPFSLSGTTLTANNAGSACGFHFDTAATTDDVRFSVSLAGAAATGLTNRAANAALGALGTRMNTTLVADSFIYMRVEIDENAGIRAYYGDVTTDPANTGPKLVVDIAGGSHIDRTALFHPYFHCVDTSTGDATLTVDFFGAKGGRSWSYT